MKILITTPLFPPELHHPAHFSKNLATHLSRHHTVDLLVYSDNPESLLVGKVINIPKKKNLFLKIPIFIKKSYDVLKNADVVILNQAGFFSLLAFLLAKLLSKKIIVKMKEDESGEKKKQFGKNYTQLKLRLIDAMQKFILKRANTIFFDHEDLKYELSERYSLSPGNLVVLKQPEHVEILPFEDSQLASQQQLETWNNYISSFVKDLEKQYE